MEWARQEKRTFLRQRIEARLANLYLETKEYSDALTLISRLLTEVTFMNFVHTLTNISPEFKMTICEGPSYCDHSLMICQTYSLECSICFIVDVENPFESDKFLSPEITWHGFKPSFANILKKAWPHQWVLPPNHYVWTKWWIPCSSLTKSINEFFDCGHLATIFLGRNPKQHRERGV